MPPVVTWLRPELPLSADSVEQFVRSGHSFSASEIFDLPPMYKTTPTIVTTPPAPATISGVRGGALFTSAEAVVEGGGAAVAVAVGGGVTWYLMSKPNDKAAIAPVVQPGFAGLAAAGRF